MNHLTNIVRKELRELLTPGAILSVVVIMVLFMCVGTAIGGESEKSSAAADVGVVYDAGYGAETAAGYSGLDTAGEIRLLVLQSYMAVYGVEKDAAESSITYLDVAYGDGKGIISAIESRDLSYVIAIPDSITSDIQLIKAADENAKTVTVGTYFVYKNEGVFSSVSSSMGVSLVSEMSTLLSYKLIGDKIGSGTALMMSPLSYGGSSNHTGVNGTVYDNITPYSLSSSTMSQGMMIPLVVMIVILMVGGVVISSMGSEKENKTLETLLTMPIRRTSIIGGKLLAAAIMGLIYGVAYMIGMMFYTSGLTVGADAVNLSEYGLALGVTDWILLMAILFLAIFSALGICMILGAFTKNYKMAQQMTMPISFLAVIPMFVFIFMSWDALPAVGKALLFLIPFSHPMMAMTNLMFGDMTLIFGGIAYLLAFDAAMILITVKIYNSDILITGLDQSKFVKNMKKAVEFGKTGKKGDDGN